MDTKIRNLMLKAAGRVAKEHMWYSPAILRLRFQEDSHCPTLAMDSHLIIHYNVDFIKSEKLDQSEENMAAVVLHEVMHYMSNHHKREIVNKYYGKASHDMHNIAMDIEINQHIDSSYLDNLGMTAKRFKYPEGKSYEWYIEKLYADVQNRKQQLQKQGQGKGQGQQPQSCSCGQDQGQGQQQDKNTQSNGNQQSQGGGNGSRSKNQQGQGQQNQNQNQSSNQNQSKNQNNQNGNQNQNQSQNQNQNNQDPGKDTKGMSGEDIIDALAKNEILKMSKIDLSGLNDDGTCEGKDVEHDVNKLNAECDEQAKGKNPGKGSSRSELITKVPKKKYTWDKVFKGIVGTKIAHAVQGYDWRTYKKVNRRMTACSPDVIYPSSYTESKVFNIVIGVDISGSMGRLTEQMYSRIRSIFDKIDNESKVYILECDTEVSKVIENFNFNATNLEVGRGGGTDMEAIPKFVEEKVRKKEWEEPDMIIIMTDNYVSWTGNSKYKKKIAVLTDNPSADCPYKQHEVIIGQDELDAQ